MEIRHYSLGFLKGVPFFLTLQHAAPYWAFAVICFQHILCIGYKISAATNQPIPQSNVANRIQLSGSHNIFFLALICCFVFLDPNVIEMPSWAYISYDGGKMSYLREVLMLITLLLAIAILKDALQGNEFTFEPIREVAFCLSEYLPQ